MKTFFTEIDFFKTLITTNRLDFSAGYRGPAQLLVNLLRPFASKPLHYGINMLQTKNNSSGIVGYTSFKIVFSSVAFCCGYVVHFVNHLLVLL